MKSKQICEIIVATENDGKWQEICEILKDLPVRVSSLQGYPGLTPGIEDGKTYEENARKKARGVLDLLKDNDFSKWVLADDTGLEVEFLGGAPGLYSARYAGSECCSQKNIEKILTQLRGIPLEKRRATFRTVMVLCGLKNQYFVTQGILEGTITEVPCGEGGFGYDPIFLVFEKNKTLAQMNASEKNTLSHRKRALVEMKKMIETKVLIDQN